MRIGIVGLGYVGGTILRACIKNNVKVETFDINPDRNPTRGSIAELARGVEVLYVAVPTPQGENGECDTSIVSSVISDIYNAFRYWELKPDIVIKSTMPPGSTDFLQSVYPDMNIFFSPEFLREATADEDFANQPMMLVGYSLFGDNYYRIEEIAYSVLENQLKLVDSAGYASICSAEVAELYKYVANTFLATKVSFANEMESIATNNDIPWDQVSDLLKQDRRLGSTHWEVPGNGGEYGFGGNCIPGDTLVIMGDGTSKPIKNMIVGDRVSSVNDLLNTVDTKSVLEVNSREYSGELCEFELSSGTFKCTPDHLVPVNRNNIWMLIPAKDVLLSDSLYVLDW